MKFARAGLENIIAATLLTLVAAVGGFLFYMWYSAFQTGLQVATSYTAIPADVVLLDASAGSNNVTLVVAVMSNKTVDIRLVELRCPDGSVHVAELLSVRKVSKNVLYVTARLDVVCPGIVTVMGVYDDGRVFLLSTPLT